MNNIINEKIHKKVQAVLNTKGFSLSPITLKNIHKEIYDVCEYRLDDVVNSGDIIYASFSLIPDLLSYEFALENDFEYVNLSKEKRIEHIAHFISRIFQICPFSYGNTLTIYVFTILYLNYLGHDIKYDISDSNLVIFENALISSIYTNEKNNEIKSIKKFSNLLKKYINLEKTSLTEKEAMVYELLRKDETSTIEDMAYLLEYSNRSIAYAMQSLREKDLIERVGSKKNGVWRIKDGRN